MTKFIPNGEKIIAKLIEKAKKKGETNVTVTGNYLINDTIIIPSNTTLILSDCHLKQADNTFCNMFRNVNCYAPSPRKKADADENIKIIGVGKAILDGGNYNGLNERNSGKDGKPHIFNNNILLFANVDGFEVRGLKVINQRHWAFNFTYCRYGRIIDIDFCADYTRLDENGNRIKGLDREKYGYTYIKNADGIDLRVGCHDIIIQNITGFTEDDTIALTALPTEYVKQTYGVEDESIDIYNVVIRDVVSAAFCTNVRLLNQGGASIHNILIDNVQDTSVDKKYYVGRGVAGVRIGDLKMYGERHSTKDETYNIVIKNVFSRAECAVSLVGEMSNVVCENVNKFDGCPVLIDDKDAKIYN